MNALETLARSALFRDFTDTGLRIFAAVAQERTVPQGGAIFVENTVGDSLFIVRSGTVRIVQRGPDGDRELGTLGAGEHLGAMALVGRSVRLVSAIAATPCELLEITQRDFAGLGPQKPQACLKLALAIAADLAARVADSRELFRELAARRPGAP